MQIQHLIKHIYNIDDQYIPLNIKNNKGKINIQFLSIFLIKFCDSMFLLLVFLESNDTIFSSNLCLTINRAVNSNIVATTNAKEIKMYAPLALNLLLERLSDLTCKKIENALFMSDIHSLLWF